MGERKAQFCGILSGTRIPPAQKTINDWLSEKRSSAEIAQPPASRQHFDVWQFQSADRESGQQSYFGAIPPQVIENLLWFWTDPGDIVDDPWAFLCLQTAYRSCCRHATTKRGAAYGPVASEFLIRRLLGVEPAIDVLVALKGWLDQKYR